MVRYCRRRRFRRRRFRRRMRCMVKATMLDLDYIYNNSFIPIIGHSTASAFVYAFLDIGTGSSSSLRSGNCVVMHSFSLRGELSIHASVIYIIVKFVFCYATSDTAGTAPAFSNIY